MAEEAQYRVRQRVLLVERLRAGGRVRVPTLSAAHQQRAVVRKSKRVLAAVKRDQGAPQQRRRAVEGRAGSAAARPRRSAPVARQPATRETWPDAQDPSSVAVLPRYAGQAGTCPDVPAFAGCSTHNACCVATPPGLPAALDCPTKLCLRSLASMATSPANAE